MLAVSDSRLQKKITSDIIHHMKYARYLEDQQRREIWEETVLRNQLMHTAQYPQLKSLISKAYQPVYDKSILPSMRSMQFAGTAILRNPARMFNCSYGPVDHPYFFAETMFLLLSGSGVGYSVQEQHVYSLPPIQAPKDKQRHLIGDSIEGWSMAVDALCRAYFYGEPLPVFDFSDIRPQGTPLKTSGGLAPGPMPLQKSLFQVQQILGSKNPGSQLHPIEAHDILCHLSEAVLAGGIRRSSYVCLFSPDDKDMLNAKMGKFWNDNPQRSRANNSAVLFRPNLNKERFHKIWDLIRDTGTGEPGIFQTNTNNMGSNPCLEIGLRDHGFCNLVEINAATISTQEELNYRARMAARIATLQASYTDFHFLRPIWKKCAQEDSLIGVGMTGIASGPVLHMDLKQAAEIVLEENQRIAKLIGINPSARCTTVKPAGTTSLILGCSSGIHAYHAEYYIRRITVKNDEPIFAFLQEHLPMLLEKSTSKPDSEHLFSIPMKAPLHAITRDKEDSLALLERVRHVYNNWILPGHIRGENTNNISCTVSIKPNEWDIIGNWMWKHRNEYVALSVLPHDGGLYQQTPFEECSKEMYLNLSQHFKELDMTTITENQDNTSHQAEAACSGGSCEINF